MCIRDRDASERDHLTSLCEIPTPKNRTDTHHSAPHLLTCFPKKSKSLAYIMPDPQPICSPLHANWAAFSSYWAHTHTHLYYILSKLKYFSKFYLKRNSTTIFFKIKTQIFHLNWIILSIIFYHYKINKLNIS